MWLSGVGLRPRRSFSLCIQIVSQFHISRHYIYKLNFGMTHVVFVLSSFRSYGDRGGTDSSKRRDRWVSNKLQALSSARQESW